MFFTQQTIDLPVTLEVAWTVKNNNNTIYIRPFQKDVSYAILVADAFALLAKGLAAVVSSGADPSVLSAENARTAINTIIKANFTGEYDTSAC